MKNRSTTDQYSDYSIFIAPSLNGHYQGYYQTLVRDYDGVSELRICKSNLNFFVQFLKIITSKKRPSHIIFLHGEKFWLCSLILLFFHFKTVLFFYYLQNKNYNALKQSLLFFIFKALKKTGILTISIELPTKFPHHLFSGILFDYVSPKILESKANRKNVRVLGYIDQRKNLPKIIDALSDISQRNFTISLEIFGKVDPDYLKLLNEIIILKQSARLSISLYNSVIDSDVFLEKISSASLVIAYYNDHYGSSGIVLESINCCTPVIFKNVGALSALTHFLDGYSTISAYEDINNLILSGLTRKQDFIINKDKLLEFRENRTMKKFAKNFWEIIE